MNEIKIEAFREGYLDEASDLLCRAFINTPFTGAIMGGNSEKHQKMLKMGFRSMLDKKPGEKVVAKDGDKIVGVMRMVKWPDCQNSIPKGLEKLPMVLFARKTASKFFEARKVWGKHDPKEPHWHVDPIGVLPEYQGKGVGSMLMKHYCRRVDSENMPAYHETDQTQNVRFYEKFGYKVIRKEPNLGIPNWYLWREPNGSSSGK
jgi:ribosomal protein S18 acetylase RimI-like enzyme